MPIDNTVDKLLHPTSDLCWICCRSVTGYETRSHRKYKHARAEKIIRELNKMWSGVKEYYLMPAPPEKAKRRT